MKTTAPSLLAVDPVPCQPPRPRAGESVRRLEQSRHHARGLARSLARARGRRLRRPAGQRRGAPARRHLGRVAHHAARVSVPGPSVRLRAELRRACASGRSATPRRSSSSPSTRIISPGAPSARSGWTAGRIRRTTRCTPRWASRPASGRRDILTVTTTHLKEGWTRRNGLTRSDRATVTEHFIRHGDHMTLVTIVNDPAYYTEPRHPQPRLRVRGGRRHRPVSRASRSRKSSGRRATSRTTCPARTRSSASIPTAHGVPPEAARGGAETMYPEYRKKIRAMKP